MTEGKQQADRPDVMARTLYTLEIIGRAHLHGGLHISEDMPLMQQREVRAALDRLAQFSSLIDTNRPKPHERPE